MKRKISFFTLLILITLTSSAFASNWVYVCNDDQFGFPLHIDSETVFKDGNTLSFWWKMIESDKTQNVWKVEATLATPRTFREFLIKDKPGNWRSVRVGSDVDKSISSALQYARDGKDTGQQPAK